MSIKRRIERLEHKAKNFVDEQEEHKNINTNVEVIQITDDDVKQIIESDLTFNNDDSVNNDNVEIDLSLLSDEMLDRLEQYVIKQERQGEK